MDVNPLVGRHRVAAVATLTDVILAQLQVAVARGQYSVQKSPVTVLICSDTQVSRERLQMFALLRCKRPNYLFPLQHINFEGTLWLMKLSEHKCILW